MLADTLKFADLCVLLSKLRDVKGVNASVMRRKLFEKFVASCADKCEVGEDPDAAFHPVGLNSQSTVSVDEADTFADARAAYWNC